MYKIDKNIPLPPRPSAPKKNGSQSYAATLRAMEVGDSFALDTLTATNRLGIYTRAKELGIKVRVSQVHMRVWRVK